MPERLSLLTAETSRGQAIREIATVLASAGIENPLREARLLLCAALDIPAAKLIASEAEPLGQATGALAAMARRRAAREPFARITGRREFYGLDLEVSSATLIPRPDTETLVDAVLAQITQRTMQQRPLMIADLGTGSGAILVALLQAVPSARGLAVDIAPGALETARNNIERLLGQGRATYHAGSWLDGLTGPFDIIVTNPPYIPSAVIAELDPEVARGEPLAALDGGPDGLDAYRLIAAQVPAVLAQDGFVAVEIGAGQAADVTQLFAAQGLRAVSAHSDLGEHIRALVFAPD